MMVPIDGWMMIMIIMIKIHDDDDDDKISHMIDGWMDG